MSVKFITCIFSDLNGTELGGRPSRGGHYRYSLLSHLQMSDADFLCYTSERELKDLENFFYIENKVDPKKLELKIFDLQTTKFQNLISEHKDVEGTKRGDRCVEIQYSKFHWWWNEDKSYDFYYWIDAGLSHCGIIPNKYLVDEHSYKRYFYSTIFDNTFLKNLCDFTRDKFFIITKDNVKNYWSGTVNRKWYNEFSMDLHVIGGMFGGHRDTWDRVVNLFEKYTEDILKEDKGLPAEENVMSLMYYNHKELFVTKYFETWWHEDNYHSFFGNQTQDVKNNYFENTKSFYKILEELKNYYE